LHTLYPKLRLTARIAFGLTVNAVPVVAEA
jgi:hypothetical protein